VVYNKKTGKEKKIVVLVCFVGCVCGGENNKGGWGEKCDKWGAQFWIESAPFTQRWCTHNKKGEENVSLEMGRTGGEGPTALHFRV